MFEDTRPAALGPDDDLAEFVKLQKTSADSAKSWSVAAQTIDSNTFDLSVKNPKGGAEIKHRKPQEIMDEIAALDAESAAVLARIRVCYEGGSGYAVETALQ